MKRATPHAVARIVARYYGVEMADMIGPSRLRHLVEARHAACAMCRLYTTATVSVIGACLRRHHASVIHGDREFWSRADTDSACARDALALGVLIEAEYGTLREARLYGRVPYDLPSPGCVEGYGVASVVRPLRGLRMSEAA